MALPLHFRSEARKTPSIVGPCRAKKMSGKAKLEDGLETLVAGIANDKNGFAKENLCPYGKCTKDGKTKEYRTVEARKNHIFLHIALKMDAELRRNGVHMSLDLFKPNVSDAGDILSSAVKVSLSPSCYI